MPDAEYPPAAYGFPVVSSSGIVLTGRGQHVGILGFGGQISQEQLKAIAPGKRVLAAAPQTITQPDAGFAQEIRMDVQIVLACAPKAQVTVYAFDATERGWVEGLRGILEDPDRPSVISVSWGWPEQTHGEPFWSKAGIADVEELLAALARCGVTVTASSGDAGPTIYYPGSSAWVLSCGGTEFCGGEERVWSMTGYASGGGMSSMIPIPAWQAQAGIVCDGEPSIARYTHRCVPDVAACAAFSSAATGGVHAGTSAAAPLWAGVMALANQRLAQLGQPPAGSIHALLYNPGTGLQAACNDIVGGNNSTSGGFPGYRAKPGWDACTGWGSPRVGPFVDALTRAMQPA
jgi:kumamolisin